MGDSKNSKAWAAVIAFFVIFSWLCRDFFHMRYPGPFIFLTLTASLLLILIYKRIYRDKDPRTRGF